MGRPKSGREGLPHRGGGTLTLACLESSPILDPQEGQGQTRGPISPGPLKRTMSSRGWAKESCHILVMSIWYLICQGEEETRKHYCNPVGRYVNEADGPCPWITGTIKYGIYLKHLAHTW